MANGVPNGGTIDLLSRVIVQVGFPVVVAAVLLWFLLTRFQDNMNLIVTRMASNTDVVAKLIANEELMLAEMRAQNEKMQYQTTYLKDIMDKASRVLAIQEERQQYYRQGKGPLRVGP